MASITWCNYYARSRDNEGAIQALFQQTWTTLAERSASHLSNAARLSETVGGHTFGSMMLVPGPKGRMQMLHHGFTYESDKMGFQLAFAQGNLGECWYFKIVPKGDVTEPIKITNGHRTTTTNCPTLESMLVALTTAEGFQTLPAQGNVILRQKPNHLIIHPEAFLMMDGASTFKSSNLAMTIIGMVRTDPDEDDQGTIEDKQSAAKGAELVLPFLRASEQGALTPVLLSDVQEN